MADFSVEELEEHRGEEHDALDDGREHDEGERDPDEGIDDTERLAAIRERCGVSIA